MLNASGLYIQVSLGMRSKKKKEGTEAVYQDSGVYHHAVSYCDIGHISADFRNDAYDFMARDKLDVKCWDIPPSSIRRISLEKRRKNSQETWLGTRPKKKNKKIPNQSFFLLLSAQGNCTNQPRRHGDRCHRLQYRWLFKSRVDVHFINSIPDTDVRGDVFFLPFMRTWSEAVNCGISVCTISRWRGCIWVVRGVKEDS